MRKSKIIYAYDESGRQAEMVNKIKGMAQIWLRTNLISNVFFYNAVRFQRDVAMYPKDIFSEVSRRSLPTTKPHTGLDYTLHIVEGVDPIVYGVEQEKMEAARKRFQTFCNKLLLGRKNNYLIITTSRDEEWWNREMGKDWTGKKIGEVWSHGKPMYSTQQHSRSHPSY
jgi:hypothetical protein